MVMVGFGFELFLIELMITYQFFCVFCTLNLVVMLLLVGISVRRNNMWQSISVCLFIYIFSGFIIQLPVSGTSEATLSPALDDIAATVANEPILHKEIEATIAGRLYSLKKDIYQLKHKQLEGRIQKRLIELEARNQGISFNDVNAYYRKNYDRLSNRKESVSEIRQLIADYLIKENRARAMREYVSPCMKSTM